MRIALVGGVFGDTSQSRLQRITPETVLECGLRERGHVVCTFSHYDPVDARAFDVVHVHHLSFGAAAMACDGSTTPFVFTFHDPKAMGVGLSSIRDLAAWLTFRACDASIALSRPEAEFQTRRYPLSGAKVEVIPNGQPADTFRLERANSRGIDGVWRLLYVGQLNPLKRVDVLLRALASLPDNVHLDLIFHVDRLLPDLRALAESLDITHRVRFLGARSPGELREAYSRADVFVLPSDGEALPTVVTEAMLCGTPVVATDVGGVRDQVGEYGVVVDPGDETQLSDAIAGVLANYTYWAARAEDIATYARDRFSVDGMIEAHERLYHAVLGSRTPRRHGLPLFVLAAPLARLALRLATRRGITRWHRRVWPQRPAL